MHGAGDALALAAFLALKQRGENSRDEMNAGARIADLRAGHQRWAVVEAGGARRAAGALGDVLVDFAVFVGTRAEAFHRSVDDARIESVNRFPGKALAIERAGREVFDHHVAAPESACETPLCLFHAWY